MRGFAGARVVHAWCTLFTPLSRSPCRPVNQSARWPAHQAATVQPGAGKRR